VRSVFAAAPVDDAIPTAIVWAAAKTERTLRCSRSSHEVVRPILRVIPIRAHPAFRRGDEDAFAIQVFFVSPVGTSEWMAILVLLETIESRNLLGSERRFDLCQ